jgi:hypothetical protein
VPPLLSIALLVFWLALAYRAYQRGDLLFASVVALVGIALTVYRLRGVRPAGTSSDPTRS